MSDPRATLSDDGLTLTVVSEADGVVRTAVYERAPETGPFDDAAIAKALAFATSPTASGLPGQRSWTLHLGPKVVAHVAVGPPTWWWPRVIVKRGEVMVGWLRGAVAVWWSR